MRIIIVFTTTLFIYTSPSINPSITNEIIADYHEVGASFSF